MDPEGYTCTNCGKFAKFTICQSDANGNRSRLMANARYVSHMPAIFTEQLRREQELLEDQRQRDADRIQNKKRSKQSVVIYA